MSSSRLQEDYLTCTLCNNPFTQPKTLPCLHNFCKACLSAYIENVMRGGRKTTFNCPECRTKIYVPDASAPITRMAPQFPTNFTLVGMIEAIAEEVANKGEGIAKVKAAMERRGLADSQGGQGSPTARSSTRSRGQNSRQSSMRREGSEDSVVSDEISSTNSKLETLEQTLLNDNLSIDKKVNALSGNQEAQKVKLENSFAKVYQLLEGRKAQLLEELSTHFSEEEDRLQQSKQGFNNDLESLKSCRELLKSLEHESVSNEAAFDMMEAIKAQIQEIEARQTQIVARTIKFEQTLEAGRSVLNLVDELGRITISTTGEIARDEDSNDGSRGNSRAGSLRSSTQNSFDSGGAEAAASRRLLAKPRFITAIPTRNSQGQRQQIYDITVMPNGTVVMTAYGENILLAAKKVDNQYKFFSELRLDSEPKSVTILGPYFVAVVGSSCIYLVSVDDRLVLKKTVHTGKAYCGIASYTETSLILCCQKPACIDFVDLNGFISETIDTDHTTGKVLLKCPQFLASSKEGVIFVTDLAKKPSLLSLNNAGKVKFQYPFDGAESLNAPQGVCCDRQGHVYLVDRAARNVTLFTPAGEKVKDLLTQQDGITDPCAIAVDVEDNLYVTNDFSEILVFKVR